MGTANRAISSWSSPPDEALRAPAEALIDAAKRAQRWTRFLAETTLLGLSATHHPAERCTGRNADRECRRHGFDRIPLHAPSGVNIKLGSGMAALFGGTARRFHAVLKGIRNGGCRPRSLARCYVNLLAHLFQYRLRHFVLTSLVSVREVCCLFAATAQGACAPAGRSLGSCLGGPQGLLSTSLNDLAGERCSELLAAHVPAGSDNSPEMHCITPLASFSPE